MVWKRSFCSVLTQRSPLKLNERVNIRIKELLSCGRGVATVDEDWKIKVIGVLPDELVNIRVTQFDSKEKTMFGEIVSILEPSQHRQEPVCQHFLKCSGCQFQHMTIEYQHDWKRNLVKQTLQQAGIDHVTVQPVIHSQHHYGYRTKLTPTLCYVGKGKKEHQKIEIGFINNLNKEPIDILQCPIATTSINEAYSKYRSHLLHKDQTEGRLTKYNRLPLLLRQSDQPKNHVEVNHHEIIFQKIDSFLFRFTANSFFQVNQFILPQFYQYVIQQSIGHSCNYLIDAYCGCGVFSIILSSYFKSVVGVDVCIQSIESARQNIRMNSTRLQNKENIVFYCENVTSFIISQLSILQKYPSNETVILLDPSRAGCELEFLNTILDLQPKKIVYIACDITTQARDSTIILNRKMYKIVHCQPFDMFPQTKHIENIITFVRTEVGEGSGVGGSE